MQLLWKRSSGELVFSFICIVFSQHISFKRSFTKTKLHPRKLRPEKLLLFSSPLLHTYFFLITRGRHLLSISWGNTSYPWKGLWYNTLTCTKYEMFSGPKCKVVHISLVYKTSLLNPYVVFWSLVFRISFSPKMLVNVYCIGQT